MTTNKDVYQDSNGGKWVRYDANGHMVKAGIPTRSTYYFDLVTGAMVKGMCTIDGIPCAFDTTTGIGLDKQWVNINGDKFWYEAASARAPLAAARKSMTPLPMPGTGWIPSKTAQWLSARMSIRTPTAASGFAMMPTAI